MFQALTCEAARTPTLFFFCTRCKDGNSEISEPRESNAQLRQTAVSQSSVMRINNIAFPAWDSPEGSNPVSVLRACKTYRDKGTALTKQHGSCHVCWKTWLEEYVILVSDPFPSSFIPVGCLDAFPFFSWMFAHLNLFLYRVLITRLLTSLARGNMLSQPFLETASISRK